MTYSNGSTFGSSTKTDHSFKNTVSVTAEASFSWVNITDTLGANAAFTKTSGSSNSLEIKKSTTDTIGPQQGPAADVIDHNTDTIWLWLRSNRQQQHHHGRRALGRREPDRGELRGVLRVLSGQGDGRRYLDVQDELRHQPPVPVRLQLAADHVPQRLLSLTALA